MTQATSTPSVWAPNKVAGLCHSELLIKLLVRLYKIRRACLGQLDFVWWELVLGNKGFAVHRWEILGISAHCLRQVGSLSQAPFPINYYNKRVPNELLMVSWLPGIIGNKIQLAGLPHFQCLSGTILRITFSYTGALTHRQHAWVLSELTWKPESDMDSKGLHGKGQSYTN